MPEPIGGRELKWEWSRAFSRFGGFLNGFAGFLGWTLVLLLPIAGVTWVYLQMCMPAHGIKFPAWTGFPWAGFVGFIKGFDSAFFTKLLQLAEAWGLLIICFVCSVITSIGFISHFFSKKRMSNSEENAPSPGSAGGRAPDSGPQQTKSKTADTALPAVGVPGDSAEQAKKNAEVDAKKQEEERRERIETARKGFKAKFAEFRKAIPSSYELSVAGGTVDFAAKFNGGPLKVTMREGSLRPYLSWNHERMMMTVSDSFAFFKDRKAKFTLEIQDPAIAADPELRDEIKSETFEVVLKAEYPAAVEKFFDWKAKTPPAVRLENAKQGQVVDFDLKTILGADPQWLTWKSADGLGSLKADFDGHRIKGLPTVGNDNRIKVVFACRGCEGLTHEFDLLLTCNMDAEQLWKQIEGDDSDKPAVVSEDETRKLAKMADAVRSTANASAVPKPDDLFTKPHRVSRRQRSGDFDLGYASIRGRSHVKGGSFREDHVEARFFLDGKAIAVVVSDGAGSAPLSRRGSCIVTSVGVRSLMELGERLLKEPDALKGRSQLAVEGFAAVVQAIRAQIGFEAECIQEQRPEFQAKEMYATFLAALILPTSDGQVLLTYSAGDGAIGLGLAGEAAGLKCVPDHGQSAGQTLFILNKGAEDACKRLVFTRLPERYALLLMSDGVSDPLIAHGEEEKAETWDALAGVLTPIVKAEPVADGDADREETYKERGGLCAWLDSYQKGHHDDRTIAVLFHKLT
jgi:hypothetical protein